MPRGLTVKDLREKLDSVRADMSKLRVELGRLEGREAMLLEMMGEETAPKKSRAPRSNVKSTVLDLLERVGATGLNAAIAVDLAADDGVRLERGSVSSLLSRMKNDGIVTYDNSMYRLPKYDQPKGVLRPVPTSGGGM